MIFEFDGKVAVAMDALIPSHYTNYEALKKTLYRYRDKPYGPKRLMVGGNGRQLLIDYDSLPREVQDALPDPRKMDHVLERFYEVDGPAVRFYSLFEFEDGTYLSSDHQERYIINASVLKSVLDLREARIADRKRKGGRVTGLMPTLLADATSFQDVLRKKHNVEHTLPTSLRHFRAALKSFEERVDGEYNYASLISGKHRNSNSRKVDESTLALLNSLFADKHRKPTAAEVSEQYDAFVSGYIEVVDNETGELYDPKGFKKLSAATITNYLHQWTSKIGTFAVRSSNRQTLMGKFKPYHTLDRPRYSGSIISIDDRQPPFKTLDGRRVWFYNGIDLGSEAFTCWVYGESKEGIITEFYRQMIRNYHEWGFHLPAELEAEMSLNSSFAETFLKPGAMFEYVRIEAHNARGKRIEAYYKPLRYKYEKKREGWLARPFALSEANQPGVEVEKVPKLPYEDIIEGCLTDIESWNNAKHAVQTDKTRWEVFCENQNPDLKPTNYRAILPHIGYRTQTSVNVGIIRLQYGEYLLGVDGKVALGEKLIELMKRVEGRDVDVYWIDGNDGEVIKALVYIGDQYMCEAVAKPTYSRAVIERTPQCEKNREIMSSYVASVDAYGRRVKQSIGQVTIIEQTKIEPEGAFRIANRRRREVIRENEHVEVLPTIEDVGMDDDWGSVMGDRGTVKSLKDRF